MMGAQVGNYSAYQLGIHDHLNDSMGGILNEYSRRGGFREAYRTGALAVHVDNDAERSSAFAGFVLMKQFYVNQAQRGEYRIVWEMKNSNNVTPVSVRVAINGVEIVASNQDESGNIYAQKFYNYDVDLAEGDLVQLFGDANVDTVWIRNFRIYYDWCIKYFGDGLGGWILAAPLVLTDAALLGVTADF
jgi:hypothetical protein